MAEVYTLGESMARISSTITGPLRHAHALGLGVAGAESNVAIGLARLGVDSRWLGRVGDDEFGRLITSVLRGEGVTADAIVDDVANTGLLFKERRTVEHSKVLYYRRASAGSRLTPEDVDRAAIEAASVLHVTGITLALSDTARAAVDHAIDIAREVGTTVSFDVNYRKTLWKDGEAGEVLRGVAARADILFAGVAEARLLVDSADDDRLVDALAELGAAEVVVKRGAAGATAIIDGARYEAPVFRVTEIDPVGAGDAFTAGYLAEFVTGGSPEQRLTTAAQCGAFAVTVEGDWEGLPSREDLHLLDQAGEVHR
ncbi:sugar kinase [Herbiconiux sp. L3-i23]|uniref:sugar kinase n=1 Tax=Herbiconiux sp. L3-i23 TaxID=2905871 RepID=UPI00205321EE|nr:sugar kinase [Herbiconiux sp. L3-i23]BDI22594.1 sugar kinase [Herbiconiux sp. L3-i23]